MADEHCRIPIENICKLELGLVSGWKREVKMICLVWFLSSIIQKNISKQSLGRTVEKRRVLNCGRIACSCRSNQYSQEAYSH
jgi:hypothetical protein